MPPKLYNLYTPQHPPPAEPAHRMQPLSTAAQILTRHEYDRLVELSVGGVLTTHNGYIWERIA